MARLLSEKRIMVPPTGGVSYIRTQIYTTSGTYTFTPGSDAKQLIIWATGGGGGGGKGGSNFNHGGGGSSGATAWKIIQPTDGALLSTYQVVVGSAGSGSTSDHSGGGNGNDTTFHAPGGSSHPHYLLAQGGRGAQSHQGGSADQGVTQTHQAECIGATYCFRGSMGHACAGGSTDEDRPCGGSVGGASHWGSGGMNGNFSNSQHGSQGRPWGSGGGPGLHKPNGTNGNGGAGRSGCCIIEVYG